MNDTFLLLNNILIEKNLVERQISKETTFEDLGLDSLDTINFFFGIEEATGVKIPDSLLVDQEIATVWRLAEWLDVQRRA